VNPISRPAESGSPTRDGVCRPPPTRLWESAPPRIRSPGRIRTDWGGRTGETFGRADGGDPSGARRPAPNRTEGLTEVGSVGSARPTGRDVRLESPTDVPRGCTADLSLLRNTGRRASTGRRTGKRVGVPASRPVRAPCARSGRRTRPRPSGGGAPPTGDPAPEWARRVRSALHGVGTEGQGQGGFVGLSVCRFPTVRRQTDNDSPTDLIASG
jgi:hypothetical protein